jgi:hypothetical protein
VACTTGLLAEDCATEHWCQALGGHREKGGWRADCPLCRASRAIEWDAPGKAVRWRSWCGQHDRDALRPVLRQLVGGCMPGRPQHRISAEDLIALASRDLPKTAYRVAMLQMAGISPREARAMLKIPESTYYDTLRVLGERRR